MKDKRVDGLQRELEDLQRELEDLQQKFDGLNKVLKRNRCVDRYWDKPLLGYVDSDSRVNLPLLEKRFYGLVEYLGLEWHVEPRKEGFREKVEEEEVI